MYRIEIALSKARIILLVIGAMVFVSLGLLFILTPETFISPVLRNELTVKLTGIAAILFFGGVGVYGVRKLFDKTVGLVIDEMGVRDNTNAASVGLIDWTDITGIATEEVLSTKFLLIYTSDPCKYLNRVSGIKRKLMQGNMKMYGTPLAITANTIKYDFDKLEKLINTRFQELKEPTSHT